MKKVNVALLGFGVVGAGVYEVLTKNRASILHREEIDFFVKRILVRSTEPGVEPNLHMAPIEKFVTAIDEITNDDSIDIVVECMGGVEPARGFILAVLEAGKTVCTSNKEVVAKHWAEFETAAKKSGAGFYIEATVGGGIPLLRTVTDSLQANNIKKVMGIINGTTNYILTSMAEQGRDFGDVLKEAQDLGYAEANPEADIEAFDATYKLSILGSMCFHAHIPIDCIHREGITKLTAKDFSTAKQLGYEIKLLAIGKKDEIGIEVRVHPTMIPKNHPLASVRGVFNAVFLNGDMVDDVMLYGRGAGMLPTASAMVADVTYAAHHMGRHRYMTFNNIPGIHEDVKLVADWESTYCIRLAVSDKPGVLASLASVFAKNDVSLKTVLQFEQSTGKGGVSEITFVTHSAHELDLQNAIKEVSALDCVHAVESIIRVEE